MRSPMRAASSVSLGSATYALAPMGTWSRQRVTDAYALERGKNRLESLCLEKLRKAVNAVAYRGILAAHFCSV